MDKIRCEWVTDDPVSIEYHDKEWGSLERFEDDCYLFEMLILEGAQAGLSWITILKRRDAYREAFRRFIPETVAGFSEEKIQELMRNEAIIRNERKIRSAVKNAKAFLKVQAEFGSFHRYIWGFAGQKQMVNGWRDASEIPVSTPLSATLAKDLKKRGFSFVGPVICYSYLQAIRLIQDHTADCFLAE